MVSEFKIAVLSVALAALTPLSPTPVSAQAKNFAPTKTARHDLDSKEADLIKREADLLKQLSADTPEKFEEEVEPRARLQAEPKAKAKAPGKFEERESLDEKKIVASDETPRLLEEKDRQIEMLSQEVTKLRNRLLLAETEVERLSTIIDERNRRQMNTYANVTPPSAAARKMAQSVPAAAANNAVRSVPAAAAASEQDMQVVTVRADKAFLRTGPGEENSPLMTVSRGTRLAVETRNGNWYRIISPAGTRAWVAANVVVFGDTDPTRATRIGGVR